MKAGEFELTCSMTRFNKVVETVTNDAEGNINFAELTFDKAGTYNYHIVEKRNTTEKVLLMMPTLLALCYCNSRC